MKRCYGDWQEALEAVLNGAIHLSEGKIVLLQDFLEGIRHLSPESIQVLAKSVDLHADEIRRVERESDMLHGCQQPQPIEASEVMLHYALCLAEGNLTALGDFLEGVKKVSPEGIKMLAKAIAVNLEEIRAAEFEAVHRKAQALLEAYDRKRK